MNTADIPCVKITENNKYSQNSITAIELNEINDEYGSKWYNRVYLCYEDIRHNEPNNSLPIKGFNCYKYNSFKNADLGWNNHRLELNKMNIRVTMIPICKWVPQILDKYILNWKLINIYWLGKHKIVQGYNSCFNGR